MSIRRIVLTGLTTAGILAGTATAAFAGNYPSPTPTPTVPVPTPVVAHPWQFDILQASIGTVLPTAVNRVDGSGALVMSNWTDIGNPNPAVDTFRRGLNSVTLLHTPLLFANVRVNPYTCTARVNQNGQFRILRGTGTGANLRSRNGQFVLQGLVSFPLTRSGLCVLRFVSRGTLLRAIQFGRSVLGVSPTFEDIGVQGRAQVFRVAPPAPRPFLTPSDTASPYVTPAVIPTHS